MRLETLWIFLILTLAAAGLPAGPLAPLLSNGSAFVREGKALPLRCVELKDLLARKAPELDAALDQAASAGFNAVGFEAPLFGPGGLSQNLGELDTAWQTAFHEVLAACGRRGLYGVPVLWTAGAVEAFAKAAGGAEKFYAGKNQMLWQAWLLNKLVSGDPGRLTTTPEVGLWLLWRGPWPGGATAAGAAGPAGAPGPLRSWLAWQAGYARRLGLRQLVGAGAWLKQDLPARPERTSGSGDAADTGPLDISAIPLSDPSLAEPGLREQKAKEMSMDALPPVPGSDDLAPPKEGSTPWDLEGLDWEAAEGGLQGLPMPGQLDAFEITLDTEDWYRVGQRLADAVAAASEVPVLWRQDWRNASAYERKKHLSPPEPLAGLAGPWPEEDWPEKDESLWPAGESLRTALTFRSVEVLAAGKGIELKVSLNRPAELEAAFGRATPLATVVKAKGPSQEHALRLKGAPKGAYFLLRLRASSSKWGQAVQRARWVRAGKQAAARAPEAAKGPAAAPQPSGPAPAAKARPKLRPWPKGHER